MKNDYDIIKKAYGEKFAKLCRTLFPQILEKEGVSTFYRLDSPVRRDDYLTETGYDKESIKKLPGEKISLVKAFETGDVEATLRKEKSDI